MRTCGECTLCCKLLPVNELAKGAGQRCKHQRHTGCAVYAMRDGRHEITAHIVEQETGKKIFKGLMPRACQIWSCRWLLNQNTADLSRPDRSHYVVDIMPDFITVIDNDGRSEQRPVIQVWIDPKHPDAHRDPALRAFLARRAAEGFAAIVRSDNVDAFVLVAPSLTGGHGWQELRTNVRPGPSHTAADIVQALGPGYVAVELKPATE